ncbi:MAG: FkbM family methyltransferase [Chthoniobacterales bacterium]
MFFKYLPEALKEKLRVRAGAITLAGRLQNLKRAGFRPKEIVDAGAFRGDWTRAAQTVFPEARFLLIEPQSDCGEALRGMLLPDGKVRLAQTLLGKENGEVRFLVEGTNSRILAADRNPGPDARVETYPVDTLQDVARKEGFEKPDFIKLDLQGHELEALAGAGDLFGSCEVFMVEVSWLQIGDAPLMQDVMSAFIAKGYRPYDICGHNYRPKDGALWQSDIIFVREDSPLIASKDWA